MKVYIVSDHQDGDYGRIVGVFDSRGKAEALIDRYREADDSDEPWPTDLDSLAYIPGLTADEHEVA